MSACAHCCLEKKIKTSVQDLLAEMQPSASSSSFNTLSALLGAATDTTAAVHSPCGLSYTEISKPE